MKRRIANWLLKHLFNAVTADDILQFDGRRLAVKGQFLTESEVAELKSGAEMIQRLVVWRLLTNELKHQANEMIYQKSQTLDDILFGKATLYTIDMMEKKLNQIASIK